MMHLDPIHFPSWLIRHLSVQSPMNNINLKRKKKIEKRRGGNLVFEALVWHSESYFVHVSLLESGYCKVICLVQSLWFVLHYQCWALTATPLGYPVVALCWFFCYILLYGNVWTIVFNVGYLKAFVHVINCVISNSGEIFKNIINLHIIQSSNIYLAHYFIWYFKSNL